jgi:hypothetical protein
MLARLGRVDCKESLDAWVRATSLRWPKMAKTSPYHAASPLAISNFLWMPGVSRSARMASINLLRQSLFV